MRISIVFLCSLLSVNALPVFAETDNSAAVSTADTSGLDSAMVDTATSMDTAAVSAGESNVIGKISDQFSNLLGDNAHDTVSGLREGEEFTLTSSYLDADGVPVTETATITPPTGKMGHGNVYITLGLAEHQLTALGITDPTALQIESALLGGTVTLSNGETVELQGVLALRSEGMGWGQIAQQYDTKLGHIIGSLKSGRTITANTATTDTSTSVTTQAKARKQPINRYAVKEYKKPLNTNASSSNVGKHSVKVSYAKGHQFGQGIVTGMGNAVSAGPSATASGAKGGGNAFGHGNTQTKVHTQSFGSGIVSAFGSSIGAGASSNAGGNGKAKGRFK